MSDHEDDLIQAVTSHVIGNFKCPRGDHYHTNLRFDPLVNPPDIFKHWGWCDVTQCPIYMFWDGVDARVK